MDSITAMKDILAKYSSNFPEKSSGVARPARALKNVLVTGTTGSLGHYLLVSLLKDSQTGTIYCLNRSGEAKDNFTGRYQEREDRVVVPEGKLKFLKVSFGDELFGLDKESFDELSEEVDIIIHNAWKVHFKHDLSSFEPQIKGLHTFISLCLSSPRQPSLYFASSIGAVIRNPTNLIPEVVIPNLKGANTIGYTQSKLICEIILDTVHRKYDLDTNVLRIGQIAGPIKDELGVWNTSEWVPSILKTSKNLGLIPETMGKREIDWIPVDSIADIIVEIIHAPKTLRTQPNDSDSGGGAPVFNLVNPTQVAFQSLTPTIQSHFSKAGQPPPKIIPYTEWVDRLDLLDKSKSDVWEKYPALKLHAWLKSTTLGREDQGEGFVTAGKTKFETRRSMRVSRRMRELEAVSGSMTRTWLRQWKL